MPIYKLFKRSPARGWLHLQIFSSGVVYTKGVENIVWGRLAGDFNNTDFSCSGMDDRSS
jgi:hypothetical protein